MIKRSFRFGLRLGLIAGLGYAAAKLRKLWQAPARDSASSADGSWPQPSAPPKVQTQAGPSPMAPQPDPDAPEGVGARTAATAPPADPPGKKVAPKKAAAKKVPDKKAAPAKKAAAGKSTGKKAVPAKKATPRPKPPQA